MKDLTRLTIDRSGPVRTTRRTAWPLLLVILIVIAATFVWWRLGAKATGAPEVEIARVTRVGGAQAQVGVAANGYVVARKRAALSTDVPGRVVEVRVEEGTRVREGDLIARLDTRQLEAQLAQVEADVRRQQATLRLAELERDRFATLYDEGHATESERDAAAARATESKATLEQLEAGSEEVRVLIRKSSVFAPFDGVVIEKNAEVGEVVSAAGSGSNSRGAVATLVAFDTLEVQVELAQRSLPAAREGAPVLIYLDAYPDDAYRGRVRQIWPTANRQKSSVEVRIEFLERNERILPDLGVRVVFNDQAVVPEPARVLLPKRALVRGPKPYVFVLRGTTAEKREIVLDPEIASGADGDQGTITVTSGLDGGEIVIVSPPQSIVDGAAVKQRKAP
ncbi:MAG: efflux RND transporter periplasmic adaptor subunit [Planctomycetota bacterium]